MADDEEATEESGESIEDLFGKGQPEADADMDADAEAEAAGADGDEVADEEGDGEATEEGDGEAAEAGDAEVDAAEREEPDGSEADADEGATEDTNTEEASATAAADGDGGSATAEDEPADDGDEPVAGSGGGATTDAGGDAQAADGGAVTSGIDESLLDADGRAGPPQPGGDTERLTTGIEALDHHLGGGIPPGRIVSFVATADTQSELLVKQLAAQHDCLYLSTLRPKWEVQEEVTDFVQKHAADSGGTDVQIEQLTADSRLDAARRHVEALDRQSVVVVDAANELETSETDRYAHFIDEVKRALWDTGSVGLFYCIEEGEPPPGRPVTLRRADLIWRLRESEEVGGIRHELLVSKFRGGRALIEPLTLWLTDEVVMEGG